LLLDPLLGLRVLFRYLAKHSGRVEGIEFFERNYLPVWLAAVGLRPPQAQAWTFENIARHIGRRKKLDP
jgi:hypothetical protein